MNNSAIDKGGKSYWESIWDESELTKAADPTIPGVNNVAIRLMATHLNDAISDRLPAKSDLIEVGCGNSAWLPYFAKRYEFNVTGVDYSERGCEQERRVMENSGVTGEVICADFFDPPAKLVENFDIITSFGVVEHFVPTKRCLSAFSRFVREGGRLITVIPNVHGSIGFLMRLMNRGLYDKHVPLNAKTLADAHEKAGLSVIYCRPIFTTNYYILNVSGLDPALVSTKIKKLIFRNLGRASLLLLAVLEKLNVEITSQMFSPYFICVAEKPRT